MLCETGEETTLEALRRRLMASSPADLQEIRLDLLEDLGDEVWPLVGSPRHIVTCRCVEDGGTFSGSQQARFLILLEALRRQPGYLEVDQYLPEEGRDRLFAQRGRTRLVSTWQLNPQGETSRALAPTVARTRADIIKLVVHADDTLDIGRLAAVLPDEDRPVVRYATGLAGIVATALYKRLKSPWTYVRSDHTGSTPEGALTLEMARAMRITRSDELAPVVLVGGPCVLRSPGTKVYNRLFSQCDIPYIYVPAPTSRPRDTMMLLEQLGAVGFSVTMPAKVAMYDLIDVAADQARMVGAINTIAIRLGRRWGTNTDVEAIESLLVPWRGESALVLGAGGAARAAMAALRRLGCPGAVSARNADAADHFASSWNIVTVPWTERGRVETKIVINATPCGEDGCSDPVPDGVNWRGRVVLDAVISDGPTPLLERVARGGGTPLRGLDWWARQGASQMTHITGRVFAAEELDRAFRT